MMHLNTKKIFILTITAVLILIFWYWYLQNDDPHELKVGLNLGFKMVSPRPQLRPFENVTMNQNYEYLATMFTSFVDDETSVKYDYRSFVQSNFLRMTTYPCFRKKVKFIVFTNSPQYRALIERDYPDVIVLNTLLRNKFITPMYKDLYQTAMKTTNSFFYMQVNACNLYDSSLVLTLEAIKQAWMRGLIRQKILIYGQKYNSPVKEHITDEQIFDNYFENAVVFVDYSQDYTIVTKETIDWHLYLEILLGRLVSDSSIVDFGVHNEVETFDASKSIRLLHQTEDDTLYSAADQQNTFENEWDTNITITTRDHFSTTCGRYSTKLDRARNRVTIYDKKTYTLLNPTSHPENYFFMLHKYWIEYHEADNSRLRKLNPSLVIIVLAFNKPESLGRLMKTLRDTHYQGDRIDLVISLDIGYMGYYDLPTLIATKSFKWTHGRKRVVLKHSHRGQLHQWLEASSLVDEGDESVQMFIVEDCVVLSPHWYRYYKAVQRYSRERSLHKHIAGWSLEAPISPQASAYSLEMFARLYAHRSSIVLSGIKRVRTFIPVRKTWSLFLKWYKTESDRIPHKFLSGTIVTQLENRGKYSGWESGMWVTWFYHFLKVNVPQKRKFLYIIDERAALAMRMQVTLDVKWFHFNGWYSNNEILRSEHGLEMGNYDLQNNTIILPEVIPRFDLEVLFEYL